MLNYFATFKGYRFYIAYQTSFLSICNLYEWGNIKLKKKYLFLNTQNNEEKQKTDSQNRS